MVGAAAALAAVSLVGGIVLGGIFSVLLARRSVVVPLGHVLDLVGFSCRCSMLLFSGCVSSQWGGRGELSIHVN